DGLGGRGNRAEDVRGLWGPVQQLGNCAYRCEHSDISARPWSRLRVAESDCTWHARCLQSRLQESRCVLSALVATALSAFPALCRQSRCRGGFRERQRRKPGRRLSNRRGARIFGAGAVARESCLLHWDGLPSSLPRRIESSPKPITRRYPPPTVPSESRCVCRKSDSSVRGYQSEDLRMGVSICGSIVAAQAGR